MSKKLAVHLFLAYIRENPHHRIMHHLKTQPRKKKKKDPIFKQVTSKTNHLRQFKGLYMHSES